MVNIREINDVGQLERSRADWDRLLAQTQHAQFFQTLDWLQVYWRHYGADQRLRVLFVEEHGQPIGILPLVVRREQTRAGKLRFLTYPLDDWGSFYGPIGPAPALVLRQGLEHIRATRRDWDVLELRFVDAEGMDAQATPNVMSATGFTPLPTQRGATAIIDLAGTYDDYLASRTSKWRNNYRRWQRRLKEQGEVSYVRYRPRGLAHGESDPRWELYDACEDIARRSWQGSSDSGTTLSHETIRPFLRDVHAVAASAGGVDMNLLFLDGRPIAFSYNYYYRGYVYGLRIGYDAEVCQDGVGNLTYTYAIEDSFARGDTVYDTGPGSLEAKRQLLTRVQPIYRYSYYRRTSWRAQLVRLKRWADARRAARECGAAAAGKPQVNPPPAAKVLQETAP